MNKVAKIITIIACIFSLLVVSFVGYTIIDAYSSNDAPIDRSTAGEEKTIDIEKSIDECTEKECLYILSGKLKNFNSYYATVNGKVTAFAGFYTQNISCEKYKSKECSFYQTISTSSLVSVCKQIFINKENQVFVREGTSKDNWSDEVITYDLSTYLDIYGTDFRALSNYTLNDSTIISATLKSKKDGIYTFIYEIDKETATAGYKINIAKMGNMSKYPTMLSCSLEVSMDSNFMPISIKSSDKYTIKQPFPTECSAELVQTFIKINDDNISIPNEDFFLNV